MRHKLYLDTRLERLSGEYPLKLVLNYKGKRLYAATGISLAPACWDARTERVTGHQAAHKYNMMLGGIRVEVDGLCLDLLDRDLPADEVKRRLVAAVSGEDWTRRDKPRLMKCYQEFADKHQGRTREQYLFTMARIRKYCPGCDDLLLEDINADWLARYDAWLSLTMKSANSRSIHMRNLRAVFNDAITRELTTNYPFRRFKIKSQPTRHRALTVEQLRELLATPCMPHEKRYLDIFLLMFLLCGISPVDLFKLERMSHGRVVFRRSKTAQPVDIRVEPEALDIITRYRGENQLINILDNYQDYDDFLKRMNRALKTLGGVSHEERVTKDKKVRLVAVRRKTWPDLSAYWARHTWASIARSLGVPMDVIAQAMGHSLHSVTDIYIARDSSLVDEANRRVIDWVLYGRR